MVGVGWAAEFFRRIAVPRLPGSPALDEVERAVAKLLEQWGYSVHRERFPTSSRRLVALSVAGAGFGWIALLIAPALVLDLPGWPVTLIGESALALVGLMSVGIAQGRHGFGKLDVRAVNTWAVRGAPKLWLVAHSDSKGQGLSLGGRVLALAAGGTGLVTLVVSLAVRALMPLPVWLVIPSVLLTTVAGAALSRGAVRDDSPGAVDNATGMVAALVAADRLGHRDDVGVLITGAEEFGMEGARAWVAAVRPVGMFINFDGLDSRGKYRVMVHEPVGRSREDRGADVAGALAESLTSTGHHVARRNLPPGVLVDGSILARAGMSGVTLSRGDWRTLRVVHTSQDAVERVDIAAAVVAGEAAARAVHVLLG